MERSGGRRKRRFVASDIKSDHKAVVVNADKSQCAQLKKTTYQRTHRPKTSTQHAMFLQHIVAMLNQYYPERTTIVTSHDTEYITPEIKAKLRLKNRLMRAGRVEEAAALAERIGNDIARRGKARLNRINGKTDAKEMWVAVRQPTTGSWSHSRDHR